VGFESLTVGSVEDHFLTLAPVGSPQSSATRRLCQDICFLQYKKVSNVDGTEGIVRYCDDFVASNRLSRQQEQVIGGTDSRRFYLAANMRDIGVSANQTSRLDRFVVYERRSSCLYLGGMAISEGSFLGGMCNRIPGLKGGRGIETALRPLRP
jgi:hypothetical protein